MTHRFVTQWTITSIIAFIIYVLTQAYFGKKKFNYIDTIFAILICSIPFFAFVLFSLGIISIIPDGLKILYKKIKNKKL